MQCHPPGPRSWPAEQRCRPGNRRPVPPWGSALKVPLPHVAAVGRHRATGCVSLVGNNPLGWSTGSRGAPWSLPVSRTAGCKKNIIIQIFSSKILFILITFSNAFSWWKRDCIPTRIFSILVELSVNQRWFSLCLGAKQVQCHCPNQCWPLG